MRRKKLKLRMDRIIIALLSLITIICLIILGIYSIVKPLTSNNKHTISQKEQSNVSSRILPENTFTPPENPDSWELILANKDNNIGKNYIPAEIKNTPEGVEIDSRILKSYIKMTEDAMDAGAPFWATSAYRSYDLQQEIFDKQIALVKEENPNYTDEQAKQQAATVVAIPGTSEHQTGLAIDIVSNEHTALDEDSENSKAVKWLKENCYKYGFILRYPKGKEHITKITYEPWHYRYVGVEAATEITTKGITLEEYLGKYTK